MVRHNIIKVLKPKNAEALRIKPPQRNKNKKRGDFLSETPQAGKQLKQHLQVQEKKKKEII